MIRASQRVEPLSLKKSQWIDVRNDHSNSGNDRQWRECEGTVLETILRELFTTLNPTDVLVIAPFRRVAEKVNQIFRQVLLGMNNTRYTQAEAQKIANEHARTVHTSQGREASVVIIVLGSKEGRDGEGSRSWANEKPNLFNVAVSRAKNRLYVIGSQEDWKDGQYSKMMFAGLAQASNEDITRSHEQKHEHR